MTPILGPLLPAVRRLAGIVVLLLTAATAAAQPAPVGLSGRVTPTG